MSGSRVGDHQGVFRRLTGVRERVGRGYKWAVSSR